jgi:hypothetical protein
MMHLIDTLGGPAEIARKVGCKPPSVVEWRARGIPVDRRASLEQHFYPRFKVEDIADGTRWVRVPDADWPNPMGRPLRDVAG